MCNLTQKALLPLPLPLIPGSSSLTTTRNTAEQLPVDCMRERRYILYWVAMSARVAWPVDSAIRATGKWRMRNAKFGEASTRSQPRSRKHYWRLSERTLIIPYHNTKQKTKTGRGPDQKRAESRWKLRSLRMARPEIEFGYSNWTVFANVLTINTSSPSDSQRAPLLA